MSHGRTCQEEGRLGQSRKLMLALRGMTLGLPH